MNQKYVRFNRNPLNESNFVFANRILFSLLFRRSWRMILRIERILHFENLPQFDADEQTKSHFFFHFLSVFSAALFDILAFFLFEIKKLAY